MKFSIVVVCLNPGEKLNRTLDSVLEQTWTDYEIIVKDGGSTDGSLKSLRSDKRIRLFQDRDSGIYDAMNQGVSHAQGEFILFLNCGDRFYDKKVLAETALRSGRVQNSENLVLYGDTYSEKADAVIASAPRITGLTCYRNIPCHQSCFYSARLCREKPYDPKYRIRADYDHFLWCRYEAGAKMVHMNLTVSSYEGGGYSESRENRKRDREEHKMITRVYMSRVELLCYRLFMLCTLAPLRSLLAQNKWSAGLYHRLKEGIYRRGNK